MATDSILRPGELKDTLLREIASADLSTVDVTEVGTVLEVRDGVAAPSLTTLYQGAQVRHEALLLLRCQGFDQRLT